MGLPAAPAPTNLATLTGWVRVNGNSAILIPANCVILYATLAELNGLLARVVRNHPGGDPAAIYAIGIREIDGVLRSFRALAAGVPLEEISEVLGHSSIEFTRKQYAHIDARRLVDGMDRMGSYLGLEKSVTGTVTRNRHEVPVMRKSL